MSESKKEFNEIPIVKLTNYSFSPPGPMGWSSAEYTTMLEDPEAFLSSYKIKHPEPRLENVMLVELPVKNRRQQEMMSAVKAEKKSPITEAAPIMKAEPEPVTMEAVQDDSFDYHYEKLMDQILDSDAEIQGKDIFIGARKRKSGMYASKRSNRVVFF
jgi:hypothetical protein